MQLSAHHGPELIEIARSVIRAVLAGKESVVPVPADPALHQPAGAFVSLHQLRTHRLRGCVGRLDAAQPMFQAVASASQNVLFDPRFGSARVGVEELPKLQIEISLIAPLRPAQSSTDFDAEHDGIYLTIGNRSGCFLPQVARETGWTKEQLLDRLCSEKLGLHARSWMRPEAKLEKFHTLLIGPTAFGNQ